VSERILVLDDEASIVEMIEQHLGDEGYACDAFTSPLKALRKLETTAYSLLLTDLKMPEMGGMEVVRRAKEIDPNLSIIVVTAMLEVTNAIDAMRTGADDYLLKPFNLTEISLAVEKAIEKRRLVLENHRYQSELEQRIQEATADLARTNQELLRTKEYLEDLLNSTVDTIITVDPQGEITFINRGGHFMLGYDEGVLERPAVDYFAGGSQELRYIKRMLKREGRIQNYETELLHQGGHYVPVSMSISQVNDENDEVFATLAICKDITEQKRLEAELKEMSIKDSLTGLYNQRYFYDRLESEIERASRQGRPLSLLLFDVDHFKHYNDCHGHLEGDRVLQTIGELVGECTREHVDIGFRYGGDEFTVILPDATQEQGLGIAERLRASFEARQFDHLTVSIGLMTYKLGTSLRSFIRSTDALMYDAKRSGGNRVYLYDYEDDESQELGPPNKIGEA
jgi:diguanylate cyclase (GGDEF)-like protein/PAS domain S-box-containing protein